ncbi:NADPH:quinone oxidoreductase family protein [Enhydrobacter sp.]|jgi:NADPH2:quinone reductase|uniref:NADPH:quinone oxidoreductase family protein n=1 Tax=Enhydrobacter sp. TaxID=1894999 RepID=UPI0026230614|nr:NADPH:quinone oxidoreductase family protein [Enhydrobacter sp.]WIM10492.1 MAG: Zinc-type alcohol dehydrogenase-like protein [Enhydrobacter sp.]
MHAVVCDRLGDPSVLKVEERPVPEPGPGEVVIRVGAAGVNFPDVLMVAGSYQHRPELPFTPGVEGAGAIHALGAEVAGWRKGDRVIFGVRPGAFAQFVKVSVKSPLLRLPDGWSYAEGAGFRVGAQTAYHSLVHRARLGEGEVLLVHGASGGVGLAAVQLGKHLGAHVIATGSDDARLAVVKAHGADEVVNYRTADFVAAVKALTAGKGADVIYDPVGGEVLEKSMRAAAYGARLLVVGFTSGGPSRIMSNHVLIKGLSVLGVRAGETVRRLSPKLGRDYLEELPRLAALGVMRPHISHRFPLDRAADAFQALLDRKVVGKVVLEMEASS